MNKEIYVVFFDGKVGALRAGRCPSKSYTDRKNFTAFVKNLIEEYPEYKIRCVQNKGIEDELRAKVLFDERIKSKCGRE